MDTENFIQSILVSALQANMTLFSRELIGQQVDVPVDLFSWSISCRVNTPS